MKTFKLKGDDRKALNLFFIENELEVWKLILDACEKCVEEDLDKIQVFKIEPEIDRLFVFKDSINETLEKALDVFIRHEEYELCEKCKKLNINI